MPGSTSKKVAAVRFDREPVLGFINPQNFLQPEGIEVLTINGAAVELPFAEMKALCFIRDFEPAPAWKENRAFANRPKTEGLWLRILFRDGDTMEGLIANDLLGIETHGLTVAPPDSGFQNQRIFVPRAALTRVQVLGVVGRPVRRAPKPKAGDKQLSMFDSRPP